MVRKMIRSAVRVQVTVSILLWSVSAGANVAVDWAQTRIDDQIESSIVTEHGLTATIVPMSPEAVIAFTYSSWVEKRLPQSVMVQRAETLVESTRDVVRAAVFVWHSGRQEHSDRSLEIPEDLVEYLFIENEAGDFARCLRANLPDIRTVNVLNRRVEIPIEFSAAEVEALSSVGNGNLTFVLGGLGFEENEFSWSYPFGRLYSDAPSELRSVYSGAGLLPAGDSGDMQAESSSMGSVVVVFTDLNGQRDDTIDEFLFEFDGESIDSMIESRAFRSDKAAIGFVLEVQAGSHEVVIRSIQDKNAFKNIGVNVKPGVVSVIEADYRFGSVVNRPVKEMTAVDWDANRDHAVPGKVVSITLVSE